MNDNCIFCQIAAGKVGKKIMENDHVCAFKDVNPQGDHHILIIPKQHISTVNDLQPEHAQIVGELFLAARDVAKELGIDGPGYRLVMNCNHDAGQSVFHIHLHLMGGQRMGWPPWPEIRA